MFSQDFYPTDDNTANGAFATEGIIVTLPEEVVVGDIVFMDIGDYQNSSDQADTANWKYVLRFIDMDDVMTTTARLYTRPYNFSAISPAILFESYRPWDISGITVYQPQGSSGNTYTIYDFGVSPIGTLYQENLNIENGKRYRLSFDITGTAGSLTVKHGNENGTTIASWTTGNSVTAYFTASTLSPMDRITFVPSEDFSGTIDNVSLINDGNTYASESNDTSNTFNNKATDTSNTFRSESNDTSNTYKTKN